jgi:hypothetical protein
MKIKMINFKSFIENDEAISGILDVLIVRCGPVMQVCAAEIGQMVGSILLAINATGGCK